MLYGLSQLATAWLILAIAGIGEKLFSRLTAVLKVSNLLAIAKRELKGDDVRNVLGLRSTRFTIAADPLGVRLAGRGWGHGLGMSQWGAYNLAQRGATYLQILGHYYPATSLAKLQIR